MSEEIPPFGDDGPYGPGNDECVLIRANWLPTPDAINALPLPLRQYIHDLHTRADPSGDVAERAIARDTCRALSLRVEELERQLADARGPSTGAQLRRITEPTAEGGAPVSTRTVARTVALVGAAAVLTWFVGVRRRASRRAVTRRRLEHLVASDRDPESSDGQARAALVDLAMSELDSWPPEPLPPRRPIAAWRLVGPSGRTVCCEIVVIQPAAGLHEVRVSYEDMDDNRVRTQMTHGLGAAIVLADEWKALLLKHSFTEAL